MGSVMVGISEAGIGSGAAGAGAGAGLRRVTVFRFAVFLVVFFAVFFFAAAFFFGAARNKGVANPNTRSNNRSLIDSSSWRLQIWGLVYMNSIIKSRYVGTNHPLPSLLSELQRAIHDERAMNSLRYDQRGDMATGCIDKLGNG